MRRTILYYPNIEIQDGEWLRNALFYWDEVSSIVPREVEDQLYTSSSVIYQLKNEGLYRPLYPDNLMNSGYMVHFENECFNRIKSYCDFANRSKGKNIRRNTTRVHIEKLYSNYNIHNDKMFSRIMDLLNERNLIYSESNGVLMDSQLASIYMSILAKYSALSDVNYTVIGSDNKSDINKVYPIKYYSKNYKYNSYRTPIVNLTLNCLPTPSVDTSFDKIIQFKRKYREELIVFRKLINDFEKEISNSESEQDLKEKTIAFKESVELGIKETTKMLKGAKIDFLFSSLQSVINLKSPTAITTYAGIAGHKLLDLYPTFIIGGIGLAGILDLSVNYISINKNTKDKLSDKGFLYLYYAKKKGIVNDFI